MKKFLLKVLFSILVICSIAIYSFISYFPAGSVILEPVGGLGNQLSQYAAAYSLAKKTDSKLFILINKNQDKKSYERRFTPNGDLALGEFSIPKESFIYENRLSQFYIKMIISSLSYDPLFRSQKETSIFQKIILKVFNIEAVSNANFSILSQKQNNRRLLMRDYFMSEIFFKDFRPDILKLLTINKLDHKRINPIINQVSSQNAVCLHLRRGDLKKAKVYLPKYEKQAISVMKKIIDNPKFFIFSDDMEEVLKEIPEFQLPNYSLVKDFSTMEEFSIMSKCYNIVTSLSSFGWWAAYLNPSKDNLVIAPYNMSLERFFWEHSDNDERYGHRSTVARAYFKKWILLRNDEEFYKGAINQELPSKEYRIYTGDTIELDICKGRGDFRSDFCIANNKLENRDPTIVTSYYPEQQASIEDSFQIKANLIVYTNKANAERVKAIRGDLPLVLIEQEIDSLSVSNTDKISFVNEAIRTNPYNSTFFIWSDVNSLQKDFTPTDKFMHQGQMSFVSVMDFSSKQNDKEAKLTGNFQVGDAMAWQAYKKLWDNNKKISYDENMIAIIAQKYPSLFNIIYQDPSDDGDRSKYGYVYYNSTRAKENE
jgi:hypothetical protein